MKLPEYMKIKDESITYGEGWSALNLIIEVDPKTWAAMHENSVDGISIDEEAPGLVEMVANRKSRA